MTSTVLPLDNSQEDLSQILDKADIIHDFTLLPISTGMERLAIFCVTHLLEEAHFFDEVDRVPSASHLEGVDVCDMGILST